MLKRTKMGGEIHMAQASMLSTSACFRAVRPTSTYCKSDVRRRHLHRNFKHLHSSVTGKRETFRLPGSFGSRRLFCRCVPPFLSSRGSSSSIWPLSSSVPRSSVPARWTSGQCTCTRHLLCSRPRDFGQVGWTDMTMQRGERCTEEEKASQASQEERIRTNRLFPSAAAVPRLSLCCAAAVALAEQVLQPFVDCPARFPPLLQHQQNHSVFKKCSWKCVL